jgi:hypothetical protein
VLEALPADVSKHFSSPDELEAKLQDMISNTDGQRLLKAYLLVHTRNPEQGVDLLQFLTAENPKDVGASRLYRHYLAKAFKE